MSEVLFPTRHRCRTCRGSLGKAGAAVLDGQYCSPKCACVAPPAAQADSAPRECRTQRDGSWMFKRRYRSVEEIPDKLRSDPSSSWYRCSHCRHLHIGHSRIGTPERFRMLMDPAADLPDLLVKLRGAASYRQVAAVAGVRPIRIKELEVGIKHADGLATLHKVLGAYGVRLGVELPTSTRTSRVS